MDGHLGCVASFSGFTTSRDSHTGVYTASRVCFTIYTRPSYNPSLVNLQRENHSAGALAWSHDCARRAQYLVNLEIAYPGSVTSDMMNANGLTCFGQNIAVGVEATSPAGACIRAIDIWQVGQMLVDKNRKLCCCHFFVVLLASTRKYAVLSCTASCIPC